MTATEVLKLKIGDSVKLNATGEICEITEIVYCAQKDPRILIRVKVKEGILGVSYLDVSTV